MGGGYGGNYGFTEREYAEAYERGKRAGINETKQALQTKLDKLFTARAKISEQIKAIETAMGVLDD